LTAAADVFPGSFEHEAVFDFSQDGVLRSIAGSLERLRLDRIDIVFIHDPDDHWQPAIGSAYPVLHELRDQGVIRAIGVGMNQVDMLTRFVREADVDVILCAGRYTLLDQGALGALLPACIERGVDVVIGGVLNSGLLADPTPGSRFDYAPASTDRIDQALRLKRVCERYAVPLLAAAIQFPLAHPAVVSVLAGVRYSHHLEDWDRMARMTIPLAVWDELREEGLLQAAAPTPD
jgi:D-threo-aldose 1-dehydrogenase